jgi:hypothetical protein
MEVCIKVVDDISDESSGTDGHFLFECPPINAVFISFYLHQNLEDRPCPECPSTSLRLEQPLWSFVTKLQTLGMM